MKMTQFEIDIPKINIPAFFTANLHKRLPEASRAAVKKLAGAKWLDLQFYISPDMDDSDFREMEMRIGVEMRLRENGTFYSGKFWMPWEEKALYHPDLKDVMFWVRVRVDYKAFSESRWMKGESVFEKRLAQEWYRAFGAMHAVRAMGNSPMTVLTDEEISTILEMPGWDDDRGASVEVDSVMSGYFEKIDRSAAWSERFRRENKNEWGKPPSAHQRLHAIPLRRNSPILREVRERSEHALSG